MIGTMRTVKMVRDHTYTQNRASVKAGRLQRKRAYLHDHPLGSIKPKQFDAFIEDLESPPSPNKKLNKLLHPTTRQDLADPGLAEDTP